MHSPHINVSSSKGYRNPLIRLYGATFMAGICFFLVFMPSGAWPFSRNYVISSNSAGTSSIWNRCASGRSSLTPIGSSPMSIVDKWSGLTFTFPSQTTTSNLNSWNSNSHRPILPWCRGLFTRYLSA